MQNIHSESAAPPNEKESITLWKGLWQLMHILVKQFHYTGGFKPRSKIPTETWATSMSLLKLLIQCQNHAGLATFKNSHQSAFDKHFKQFVESGPYKSSSCVLKQLTTHSNTSALYFCREEMNPSQKNKKPVLTTVQQRGQNHHRKARASIRKRIRRAMKRMVPVSCKQDDYFWVTCTCHKAGALKLHI